MPITTELRAERRVVTALFVDGDAIHALFGAPIAHADDPQRALRAARGCVRWTEHHEQDRIAFRVRIAIETGEAIVDLDAVEARVSK